MSGQYLVSGLTVSFLVDQLCEGAGGGRFTTGFLRTLLNTPGCLGRIDQLFLVRTMNEHTQCLGALPPNVHVITRRFPSRLRGTLAASLFARFLPRTRVAHGPFYYIFPGQSKQEIVTLHDLSFHNPDFHSCKSSLARLRTVKQALMRCTAIVCTSDAILRECQERYPATAHKTIRIYDGVTPLRVTHDISSVMSIPNNRPCILAVGTIEPRKNYDVLLNAYEHLLSQDQVQHPVLIIVGRGGWMCESTLRRIESLEKRGQVYWRQSATDDELAGWYGRADVFTYLSLYEGFGYPPFEAAFANAPMVLSNRSSVGEIWDGYARCIDPTDIDAIVTGWRWALGLSSIERETVALRQRHRAETFTWERCVTEYIDLYADLCTRPAQR